MNTSFTQHGDFWTCALIGEGGFAEATGEGGTKREALVDALCALGWAYEDAAAMADTCPAL